MIHISTGCCLTVLKMARLARSLPKKWKQKCVTEKMLSFNMSFLLDSFRLPHFFWFLFMPHFPPFLAPWFTRLGSQQNVNLWSQKRFSLSVSKTLASSLYLSSSWFFGSFIYLVSFVDYCMNVNNKDIPYLLCGKCCHGPMNKEILGF